MKRNLPQSVCVRRPLRVLDRISLETPDPHCSCFITAQLNVIHPDENAVLFAVGLELARPSVRTLEGAGNRQLVVPRHRYLICPGFRLIYIFDNRRFTRTILPAPEFPLHRTSQDNLSAIRVPPLRKIIFLRSGNSATLRLSPRSRLFSPARCIPGWEVSQERQTQ